MSAPRIFRRVLADIVGCAVLAVLLDLAMYGISPGDTLLQTGSWFFDFYAILAVSGYVAWLRMEKRPERLSWLWFALGSPAAGALSLSHDMLVGHFLNPSLPLLKAAESTGLGFGLTLIICPGLTIIALSGWVRSLILGEPAIPS